MWLLYFILRAQYIGNGCSVLGLKTRKWLLKRYEKNLKVRGRKKIRKELISDGKDRKMLIWKRIRRHEKLVNVFGRPVQVYHYPAYFIFITYFFILPFSMLYYQSPLATQEHLQRAMNSQRITICFFCLIPLARFSEAGRRKTLFWMLFLILLREAQCILYDSDALLSSRFQRTHFVPS